MHRAEYIGTVSLKFLDQSANNWIAGTVNDIFASNLITQPQDHLFTLGSGVASSMVSLATTPAYPLPTTSQIYLAGRDVFRWGGVKDPCQIDIDHYGFTPDYNRDVAVMWKAPKSEPHHLSEIPSLFVNIPEDWKEICKEVLKGQLL